MKHTKQILLVFPGLGKTTAAKSLPGLADCDYGYYRAGMKEWITRRLYHLDADMYLNRFCQTVLHIYAKEGFIVLTNEPALIPWIKQLDVQITMVLPEDGIDMGERMLKREAEHPVNRLWASQYALKWKSWVEDWLVKADKYSIPVVQVEYLKQDWTVVENAISNCSDD